MEAAVGRTHGCRVVAIRWAGISTLLGRQPDVVK
jgi:hypothetical protein